MKSVAATRISLIAHFDSGGNDGLAAVRDVNAESLVKCSINSFFPQRFKVNKNEYLETFSLFFLSYFLVYLSQKGREMSTTVTDFHLKFDIKSANHLNSIKFTPKVESSVLNPMEVLKKPQVKPFLNCKTKCSTPFVESTSTVDTDFH